MTHSILEDLGPSEHHGDFRLLAESIPNLAWIAASDGSIYWYNRRWFEYTGTTPESMEGWGWQSVHDPAVLPSVLERWRTLIATGEPFEMTFPLRRHDGVFLPFLTRVVPLKDEDGKVIRWFGTNTEIGDELRTLNALRESEERFRVATEAASDIVWTNDATGEMRGEQAAWGTFTGQTQAQYQGFGWSAALHPDDAQPTIDAWYAAVQSKSLFSFEHRVRRHDGVYRTCTIRALPVRNQDGSLREWVGVHHDITEERDMQRTLVQAVTSLKEQEELVEAAQITNNVGFWRLHPRRGRLFLSSGNRTLLGFSPTEDVSLEEALDRLHVEDAPRVRQALQNAELTGSYCEEFRTAHRTHTPGRWLLGAARLLHTGDDEPYFVGIHLDITQQKQSADALMRTEKLAVAGRLAASIAHEINNPLEAVTNLLYLLRQTALDAEQESFCQIMADELQRVTEIATHSLRFHRQSTRAGDTSVNPLVRSVLTLFGGRIRNAEVTVECRLEAQTAVFGFDGELRQVLANLVGNAIDALAGAPGTRTLLLRTRDVSGGPSATPGILVTVADSGPGIPAALLQRIFDPFFTTKGDTGTGLGLWVSSEIVRKHQGTMKVRSSQHVNRRGTVFQLFLPLDPGTVR